MARRTLEEAENYPGELEALRAVLTRADEAAQSGSLDWVRRVLQQHHDAEDAAVSALPWAPEVGTVYGLKDGSGVERYRVRVICEGLWVKKITNRPGTGLRTGGYEVNIRRTTTTKEGATSGKVGMSRVGRLVLMTSGGAVMGSEDENAALAAFELPEMPRSTDAADMALQSIQTAGKTAGLILNVRESNDFVVIAGESQQ